MKQGAATDTTAWPVKASSNSTANVRFIGLMVGNYTLFVWFMLVGDWLGVTAYMKIGWVSRRTLKLAGLNCSDTKSIRC
jgi:hypothetical protein